LQPLRLLVVLLAWPALARLRRPATAIDQG